MPVIYSYPKGTSIIDSDSVLGTDQSNKNNTVTYTMVDIKDYVLKDLLDGVQFRLPIYGKPKVLTNSLLYQDTAAEAGTQILGSTVYLNNGNNVGNLIVAQNITASDGNIVSTLGNIAAGGSIAAGQATADASYRLKVNGASKFTGSIVADSTLTVGGAATFNAAVQANSTVNVVGTLTASGTSNLDGIVRLGGAVPSSSTGIFLNRLTYLNSDTTLGPAATLALQGPIRDSSGVLGSNEQVLVSDANGKMSWQFYQSSGLEFQASWNASTDVPDLTSISLIEANVGKYWVVSVAGNTSLSGITDWQIGDWAIVSRDSSDTVFWSKIDNSAAITGTGTNGTLTKWTGPTTLGDSIISESGTTLTIAGDLTLERDQSDTTLTLVSDGSNVGPGGEQHNPSIKFIQDGGAQNAAVGFNIIDDTGGGTIPGSGNRFWIVNAMDDLVGGGGITFGTAQVDGWDNAIGRFIIRGDGKGLFGHPDSLYNKTLGSQFEIYDNRDENTTTDPSFSVYSVVDVAAPSGNEGAGGIKQILDVYDNGVFSQQEALMLIPGTSASDFAASTPIAFYTNSDMDTASPSGFAGIIFDSGNWLLDGSGTFTTVDPGYQLKVAGTGFFTDQVTIPITPVAGTDAASKAYVDSQSSGGGTVTGTGTTNTLPIWSDGPNGVLSDSRINQILDGGGNVKEVDITTTSGQAGKWNFNGGATKFSMYNTDPNNPSFLLSGDNTGFYSRNFQMYGTLAVGRSQQSTNVTLDVGAPTDAIPAAWFRNGVVISNNPSGVSVDNTSMVIGAGNNDNVSGSDHCLIVGSGNQITSNSDQSVAFGQGNAITSSIDAFAVGNSNTLTSSLRTQAIGFNNTVQAASSFVAGGGNSITANANIFALGDGHTVTTTGSTEDAYLIGTSNTITGGTGSFAIGSNLDGDTGNHMVVGYRNDKTSYPTTNYSLGLGNTKFALAVGSTTTTNSNALLITEGGVNRGGGVAQVPRVLLPTIVGFNYANDTAAAAGGIPIGGLYHNAGVLRIRLT